MKTFEVTITKKWIELELNYVLANSHKEVAEKLEKKNKRVMNDRYRQIEKTGEYYRITEMGKGGKSLIYEVL
jgi:hypothetical protein